MNECGKRQMHAEARRGVAVYVARQMMLAFTAKQDERMRKKANASAEARRGVAVYVARQMMLACCCKRWAWQGVVMNKICLWLARSVATPRPQQ